MGREPCVLELLILGNDNDNNDGDIKRKFGDLGINNNYV